MNSISRTKDTALCSVKQEYFFDSFGIKARHSYSITFGLIYSVESYGSYWDK